MKIGFVHYEYPEETTGGGAGVYTHLLATSLAQRGHDVHVVAMGKNGVFTREQEGVTVHRIVPRTLYPQKGSLSEYLRRLEYSYAVREKLLELAGTGKIEIVENHLIGAEVFLYSVGPITPIVTHLSTTHRDVARCQNWEMTSDLSLSMTLEDEVICRSQRLISSTHVQAEAVTRRFSITKGKISVIPIGIPLPGKITTKQTQSQANHKKGTHVLFIGRLERRKGVHTLIEAIPKVLDQEPATIFSLIGADTYASASALEMEGNANSSFKRQLLMVLPQRYWPHVRFLGFCDQKTRDKLLDDCDLFVAPSLYESFGIVYLEAMAHRKPVIGCRTGGVVEVIEDGRNGLLVPVEDSGKLAEALLKLIRNPKLRWELGKNGRRLVETRYGLDSMVDSTLEVYEKVLHGR
ncbi:MAG: glycosyltransferase family 4 protein [Candidatus Omnitrophica bacterium]|nr:glycosyltransferase family 4 protein [Candidatus Omnitrophota bacterium]